MGFPIRKSTDQGVFAPPRSLSQRITSFIACACQGIHQLPLRHLIILIANAHPGSLLRRILAEKTSFSRSARWPAVRRANHVPEIERLRRRTSIHQHQAAYGRLRTFQGQAPNGEPEQIFSSRCHTEQAAGRGLLQTCFLANDALASNGGAGRDRTDDPLLAKQVLSQLSYGP